MHIPDDIAEIEHRFHAIGPGDNEAFERYRRVAIEFQRDANPVYARYAPHVYLPVRAFKDARVVSFPADEAEAVFVSSGTGGSRRRSRHYVRRLDVYRRAVVTHFHLAFGSGPFTFLFYLPDSSTSRAESSLVNMAVMLERAFGNGLGGFLTSSSFDSERAMEASVSEDQPVFVLGTAFGLLDWIEAGAFGLPENAFVLETGGMKTHRRDMQRDSLHAALADGLCLPRSRIGSEYGMCELMSQFYMSADGLFRGPPWVRFAVMDPDHPERELSDGDAGALAVLDLANVYSVCAVLTQDRAVRRDDGFELLGRLSGAELRGCNFLLEDTL